jgi:hypothetical protein
MGKKDKLDSKKEHSGIHRKLGSVDGIIFWATHCTLGLIVIRNPKATVFINL